MTNRHDRHEPMDSGKTNLREHVDARKWARRHLRIAVAAETIDEADYHISMARQLLLKTMTENTAQQVVGHGYSSTIRNAGDEPPS